MYFQLFFAHFDFKLKLHWTPASYYQDCLCEFSNIIDNHPSRSNTHLRITSAAFFFFFLSHFRPILHDLYMGAFFSQGTPLWPWPVVIQSALAFALTTFTSPAAET